MRLNHVMLAILTAALWGCNFIFVTLALRDVPPYLLCTLRFFLTAVPAVFFFPRPAIPFQHMFVYGLFTFALQFAFLFAGIYAGMPPGLTSLVFQSQIFFSILFAAVYLGEIPSPIQIIGAIISAMGLGLVWVKYTDNAPWIGLLMILMAALSMGIGNLFARKLKHVPPPTLIAWGSLMALPILVLCTLSLEGPEEIIRSLKHLSWTTTGSLLFIAYGSTWLAYGVWNHLLGLYEVAIVIPFSLLVPFFAMVAGSLLFNEPMQEWKLCAAWLIIGGLVVNILGSRWLARHHAAPPKLTALDG